MINNVSFKGVYTMKEFSRITEQKESTVNQWCRNGKIHPIVIDAESLHPRYRIDTDNKQTRAFLEKKKLDTTIDEYEAANPPLRKIDHSEEVKVDSNKVIIDCLTNIISNASNALNEINKK